MTMEEGNSLVFQEIQGDLLALTSTLKLEILKQKHPNPLQLGFDMYLIVFVQLFRVYIDTKSYLTELERKFPFLSPSRENDSVYSSQLLRLSGEQGFGIRLFDRQDMSYNRNGIYRAEVLINGRSVFSYTFDKIDFSDGKKIDALIDFTTYRDERIRIQKLFRDLNVNYSFLPQEAPDGFSI